MLLFSQGTHEDTIVERHAANDPASREVLLLWAFVCPALTWHCFPPTFFDKEEEKDSSSWGDFFVQNKCDVLFESPLFFKVLQSLAGLLFCK